MRHGDKQLGIPYVEYTDIKANIEALASIDAGSHAFATDTHEPGWYDGAIWRWTTGSNPMPAIGQYRQFIYEVHGGDFYFVTTSDGQPVMALQSLE